MSRRMPSVAFVTPVTTADAGKTASPTQRTCGLQAWAASLPTSWRRTATTCTFTICRSRTVTVAPGTAPSTHYARRCFTPPHTPCLFRLGNMAPTGMAVLFLQLYYNGILIFRISAAIVPGIAFSPPPGGSPTAPCTAARTCLRTHPFQPGTAPTRKDGTWPWWRWADHAFHATWAAARARHALHLGPPPCPLLPIPIHPNCDVVQDRTQLRLRVPHPHHTTRGIGVTASLPASPGGILPPPRHANYPPTHTFCLRVPLGAARRFPAYIVPPAIARLPATTYR